MNLDNTSLLLMKEIKIDGVGIIKQPTLNDILSIGLDNFTQMITPYQLTLDMLNISDEEKLHFKVFDMFFIKEPDGNSNEASMVFLLNLLQSIKFFLGTENVDIDFDNKIIILDKGNYISRDNFDNIADIILKFTKSEKIKVEKEDVNKSERKKEIDKKLAEGRKKKQKESAITMLDMINILIHSDNTKFDYQNILNLTYLQIINSYEVIMNIENFHINLAFVNGFSDIKSLDLTHWSEKIRELKPKVVQEGTL